MARKRKDLEDFKILSQESISSAFKKINANAGGFILVTGTSGSAIGLATDGDIRKFLVSSPDLNAPIDSCMNTAFVRAYPDTPRELILKMLDHKIHFVPILDAEGTLVDVVSRHDFPLKKETNIIARARSPVRISFGGGGSDLTHYFIEHGGVVLNATVQMYSHATLVKRNDYNVNIHSLDLNQRCTATSNLSDLDLNGPLKLITHLLKLIEPGFGFDLTINSDFPVGSGLGGSAVVLTAILGCFNQFRHDRWDSYEIAELAFQAERLSLGVAGGWQDQYATVFGGFNFMEFTNESNIVHPLRLGREAQLELEASLTLCHTNQLRDSGEIHKSQKQSYEGSKSIHELVEANKALTYRMKTELLRGNVQIFGDLLDEAWQAKRQFSEKISNEKIDDLYEKAKECGATGGKLLGAGGGGYLLLFTDPLKRHSLCSMLQEAGYNPFPVQFDQNGLQSWRVRQK